MAQARSLQSAVPPRDRRRERARNLRVGLVLIGMFVALFVGSIIYILLFPRVK